MKWRCLVAMAALMVCSSATAGVARAESPHSDNMSLIGNWTNGTGDYQGSDLAFWGDTAVLGMYAGPGGIGLLNIADPAHPQLKGILNCPGSQADVSIWHDLVVVSVDSPRGAKNAKGETVPPNSCGATGASQNETESATSWEGLRLVSIADPAHPVQIGTVRTDCGSHTNTLVPDPEHGRLYAYVLSYPLGAPLPDCNVASHRKVSIVEIPIANPAASKVIGSLDVSPNIGCHDLTVFMPRHLVGAACISESMIWDVSDPAKPKVLAHIPNPRNNIHHSASFSWDGKIMVLGDELGGAEVAPGCATGQDNGGFGGLWFYDVTDPSNPVEKGDYRNPQMSNSTECTAHLFNIVPLRSEKNILVTSWYELGTAVVDFTDPSNPKQIAYYTPQDPVQGVNGDAAAANMWSAYWYNGHVYANNFAARGFDVFDVRDPAFAAEIPLPHLNPQIQEPLPAPAATPGAGESIALPSAGATGKTGSRCVSRRGFKMRLKAPRGRKLSSALVYVGGRRAKVVRGKALRRPVALRGLPKGRVRIDVTLRTKKGRRISRSKTYRFC